MSHINFVKLLDCERKEKFEKIYKLISPQFTKTRYGDISRIDIKVKGTESIYYNKYIRAKYLCIIKYCYTCYPANYRIVSDSYKNIIIDYM